MCYLLWERRRRPKKPPAQEASPHFRGCFSPRRVEDGSRGRSIAAAMRYEGGVAGPTSPINLWRFWFPAVALFPAVE